MDDQLNTIVNGDCIAGMNALPAGSIDLAFADPPFNIGYEYDVYQDRKHTEEYLAWSHDWIAAVHRVLKPDGTFWLAIGDEYAAELKIASQQIGFHTRSWVIWYYTFGVNCKRKFSRSHAHLFHFVKDPERFTFRSEEPENRIPSARQLVYNDNRANPKGRLPDDTWIIHPADCVGELLAEDGTWSPLDIETPSDTEQTFTLRPQDLSTRFRPHEDTWYFPRVAGTFKERAGFHGCQMPEQLLGRIIRFCSEPRQIILDPFSGSATTLAVAKKLGRRFIGFELSAEYAKQGVSRLNSIRVGDPLDGSEEPTASAPPTRVIDNRRQSFDSSSANVASTSSVRNGVRDLDLTVTGIIEAYSATHAGYSADRVIADPELSEQFSEYCRKLSLPGDTVTWNTLLLRLRKAGKLTQIPTTEITKINLFDCDRYLFASEIAWQMLVSNEKARSLDEILCNPELVREFDNIAQSYAPGFSSLEYRWAALKLRKQASKARVISAILSKPYLGKYFSIDNVSIKDLPDKPAIYLISEQSSGKLYAGETLNLRERFLKKFGDERTLLWHTNGASRFQFKLIGDQKSLELAWQSRLVQSFKPKLNSVAFNSVQAA